VYGVKNVVYVEGQPFFVSHGGRRTGVRSNWNT